MKYEHRQSNVGASSLPCKGRRCPSEQAVGDPRVAPEPMEAFCRLAEEAGCPLTVGELWALGLENSDNQCKSTNGGNPSPYESFDDEYENFLASL